MNVIIRTARPLRWHAELVRRLEASGYRVVWTAGCQGPALPSALFWLFELEQLIYRRRGARLWEEVVPPRGTQRSADEAPALRLDLSGHDAAPDADLRVLYDGIADCAAAVAALLDGRPPQLHIVGTRGVVAAGLPANEDPGLVSAGLDAVYARVIDLCLRAVAHMALDPGRNQVRVDGAVPVGSCRLVTRTAVFSLSTLRNKVQGLLLRRLRQAEAWRVGVRASEGPTIVETGRIPVEGFQWLPDDGARYYADPFLVHHRDRTWMFVEEFPYASQKGVISVCEVSADGRCGPVRPVLEEPVHLSYPYVFAQDGEFWMMPESSASRDLVLYRATDFPYVWRRERVLIDGVPLADATLFRHDDRLWIFAATAETPGGSSWDALSLFHAADLDGDFVPHPLNPVVVDVRAARPAGRLMRHNGIVVRTAQNCQGGYGAGISVAEVGRLDVVDYQQTVRAELTAPALWKASGLHTINTAGGLEAIDILSAQAPQMADRADAPRSG